MSIFHDALKVILNDIKICTEDAGNALLHADLSNDKYLNIKGKFHTFGFTFNLVKKVADWIEANPDETKIPDSFLNDSNDVPKSEMTPEVHTISMDSSVSERH
jgi:hypothetical protein